MSKYRVEQITKDRVLVDGQLYSYFQHVGKSCSKIFDNKLSWRNFLPATYAEKYRFIVCFRGEEPVGVSLSRLYNSILDPKVRILYQDLIFASPGTRAASYLYRDLIDFGKANADHILSARAPKTNIKSSSLEKLGFKELEILYRLEV